MTDAEAAQVLRDMAPLPQFGDTPETFPRQMAAIHRAIEALGEVERLRVQLDFVMKRFEKVADERDAALAECERLRNRTLTFQEFNGMLISRDAWRACADQLAAALRFRGAGQNGRESLAVYEKLKGADS